jgi:hypothetical protein
VVGGREYRSFVQQSRAGKDVNYWKAAVHPGGRFLAIAMSDHARLFDLATGDELAALPQSGFTVAFQGSEAVLTNGSDGLLRWPLRPDRTRPNGWRLGPPERLHQGTFLDMASDSTGNVIAQADGDGAFLVRSGRGVTHLGPHADGRHVAVSPDGKYVATGNHDGNEGVKVWDAETGRLLVRIPVGSYCGGLFSPDGRWLAVQGTAGCRLVKVGSWEVRPLDRWDGSTAFSADGSLVAVGLANGVIRLLDPATWTEVTRLEDPNQGRAGWLNFLPDGTGLVANFSDGGPLFVWDLRAVRNQLAAMGLDWDQPPYPPVPEREAAPEDARPLEVKFVGADWLTSPEAEGLNDRAWELLTGPAGQRDPAQALRLIEQAVKQAPKDSYLLNTLGVAQYRNGQYAPAVATLERSLAAGRGQFDAFDLYFLAMCHARLGDAARARECFERATRWAESRTDLAPQHAEELKAFRAEAEVELRGR